MYFSGKGLAKFAALTYAVHVLGKDASLANMGLQELKQCFAVFVENRQPVPLVYDAVWGGVVSSAVYYSHDPLVDFGNGYYNDHHFHYSYFVYTAAVIGHLDPAWLSQGTNRAWVDMLLRDYAGSLVGQLDQHFPKSRAFDWYHGHSWAKGLFPSADGKDQESTSEDALASYAIKMWGSTIGDSMLEVQGTLMLAIQANVFKTYFLYGGSTKGKDVQPQRFVGNMVGGILFENKIDHTTYFGADPSFIHGIHMLPLLPYTPLIRSPAFVKEEWEAFFSNGRAEQAPGGWQGVLYANLALSDPQASWKFFTRNGFNMQALDGGASLTWYCAWIAAIGKL